VADRAILRAASAASVPEFERNTLPKEEGKSESRRSMNAVRTGFAYPLPK